MIPKAQHRFCSMVLYGAPCALLAVCLFYSSKEDLTVDIVDYRDHSHPSLLGLLPRSATTAPTLR